MTKLILREVLRGPIVGLSEIRTHKDLPELCESLALPPPDTEGSKRARMEKSFDSATDLDLRAVASKFLRLFPPSANLRNNIQDLLWADMNIPEIPKRFRRELARNLGAAGELYRDWGCFENLLDSLWILDDDPFDLFGLNPSRLRKRIRQHVMLNTADWTSEYLFETLGALDCSDQRFALFLEGLACADVLPDVAGQHRFVGIVNDSLRPCLAELRETATKGGYPVFSLCWRTHGARGKAKNLIFASQAKPDLRFRDAVNNDIEIISNADAVLIYDEPIPDHGLLWSDLQTWWANRNGVVDSDAKRTLYRRLLASLPDNSPAQRILFQSYFKSFRETVPNLPALLPEVWLHWDPKTVHERGRDALLRFRMDFLMLLPHNVRVVIEVDGKHHYADTADRADPHKYANMMAADRDLRLTGYDVYHFGAQELNMESARSMVCDFFERLFELHHVTFKKAE